jgi:hypothetical protein
MSLQITPVKYDVYYAMLVYMILTVETLGIDSTSLHSYFHLLDLALIIN